MRKLFLVQQDIRAGSNLEAFEVYSYHVSVSVLGVVCVVALHVFHAAHCIQALFVIL